MPRALKHWIFAAFFCTLTAIQAQRTPSSAASGNPSSIDIHPRVEDWVVLQSNAFFSKPTTLLEHREVAKLRGILSARWSSAKKGQPFNEASRLQDACKHIPQSYSATKNHTVVRAKVVAGELPHCRIVVRDKDGLVIEQVLFVGRGLKKSRIYVTHTATFFYPVADEARATLEVTKFLSSVSRRKDG